jgi:hypothetical protein
LLSPEEKVVVIYNRQPIPGARPNKLATAMTASLETYKCIDIKGPAVFVCPHPEQNLSIPAMKAMHHVITDDLDIVVVNNRESGPLMGNTQAIKKSRFDMIVHLYRGQLKARERDTFTELPDGASDPATYYGPTGEKMSMNMKYVARLVRYDVHIDSPRTKFAVPFKSFTRPNKLHEWLQGVPQSLQTIHIAMSRSAETAITPLNM